MAIRAPPRRPPPPAASASDATEDLDTWIARRAMNQLLRKQFSLELEQGILDFADVQAYKEIPIPLVQSEISGIRVELEMFRADYPDFDTKLAGAVRSRAYDVDFHGWFEDQVNSLEEFRNGEVVYFRKRTTAFVLEKPCPNCGKRELIAEAAVFTRAADEAVDQFATCKNCSARYRLQSVI